MGSKTRSILKKLCIATVAAAAWITLACDAPPSPATPEPGEAKTGEAKILPPTNSDWSAEERQWFYHASQGSRLMPYKWFISLEQVDSRESFLDPDHLAQFRMIPDPDRADHLPVGFAVDCIDPVDPASPTPQEPYVGMSCAVCHTGQVNYKGTSLLIDGAPSQINAFVLLEHLGVATIATELEPTKFDRFAKKVLGTGYNSANKDQLWKELRSYAGGQLKELHPFAIVENDLKMTTPGFGRMDALGFGSNALFSQLNPNNLRNLEAPVDIIPLWNAYSYGWVQSIGAIRQPMARNIIEALSMFIYLDLPGPPGGAKNGYLSSVRMTNLRRMEGMAARLAPPQWPSMFPAPDPEKARRGQVLYQELCARCHVPQLETPATNDYVKALGPPDLPNYPPDPVSEATHKRFYHLPLADLKTIGTDPHDAVDFAERTVDATAMGLGADEPVANVIVPVTSGVMQYYYNEHNVPLPEQPGWNGDRGNYWRTPRAYPAQPLAGIWATAPFLHNGSVPNLYELLSPVEARSKTFYRGNLEFDPVKVGFVDTKSDDGFELNTSLPGNSNAGHEFRDGGGNGVIGRKLTEDERWQIIEYLKTLSFQNEVQRPPMPTSSECDWPPAGVPQPQSAPAPGTSQTSSGGSTGSPR